MSYLVIAGLLVIVLLSAYAGWLWVRVHRNSRARLELDVSRRQAVLEGLEVLARGLQQGQVNVTEAALRMAALLDNLDISPQPRVDLAAIHQLAEAAMHLHTGARREALSRAQRDEEDSQRERLEAEQGEAVIAAAGRLLEAVPRWRQAAKLS